MRTSCAAVTGFSPVSPALGAALPLLCVDKDLPPAGRPGGPARGARGAGARPHLPHGHQGALRGLIWSSRPLLASLPGDKVVWARSHIHVQGRLNGGSGTVSAGGGREPLHLLLVLLGRFTSS